MIGNPQTGTRPASYTLGLIEAMMTGIPVVSMPPSLVEALVSRGDAMMARRDISAARLLYERAAVDAVLAADDPAEHPGWDVVQQRKVVRPG